MAYWLVPSAEVGIELQRIVSELSSRFDGPVFVPHVTVYFGPYHNDDSVDVILDALSRFEALSLKTEAMKFTEEFTKSCYLQFESCELFGRMNNAVTKHLHDPVRYDASPHLSLFYGKLTALQQKTIAAEFTIPKSIQFETAVAIANPPQVESRADVEAWREVARRDLAPGRTT